MKEKKKVLVSGCYDGVHQGQKKFLKEASAFGRLHVSIATDETIIDLKSNGDADFELLTGEQERLKLVSELPYVYEAFISTGMGEFNFLDDLNRIKPDILVVNNDGDSQAKRRLCQERGMEYIVLERVPPPGMEGISSTKLREERKNGKIW